MILESITQDTTADDNSMKRITGHADAVRSVLNGQVDDDIDIPAHIQRSWIRCNERYTLDVGQTAQSAQTDTSDLQARLHRLSRLLSIARLEMESILERIENQAYMLLLTDEDGVVMECLQNEEFSKFSTENGITLRQGTVCHEQSEGCNAVGICQSEWSSIRVLGNQHYLQRNICLNTTAAPVFSTDSELLAILGIVSNAQDTQHHSLALAQLTAQAIENQYFLNVYKDHYILRLNRYREQAVTTKDALIAFDNHGKVLQFSRNTSSVLGNSLSEALVDARIDEIFEIDPVRLADPITRYTYHPFEVGLLQSSEIFHGVVQPPESFSSSSVYMFRDHETGHAEQGAHGHFENLEYGDSRMAANIQRVRRILDKDIPVLLHGETGTGKGVFARALHLASKRADHPFVAVNCASIPETLIESELFGYRSGAFTGARREGSRGKIVHANGGTLFLDEIGDMPPQLQARLLRVLEDKEVVPLGSETAIHVDINVISATHRSLESLIQQNIFREDLYYRLHGISLTMPALRDREDKIALIQNLLQAGDEGEEPYSVTPEVMEILTSYTWPGNIRQLYNVIRSTRAFCTGRIIRVSDLPEEITQAPSNLGQTPDGQQQFAHSIENPVAIAERDAIMSELRALRWNVTKVSKKLGMSRNTLYRKMKRFGITPPR